jgi:hypothetical protein
MDLKMNHHPSSMARKRMNIVILLLFLPVMAKAIPTNQKSYTNN